MSGGTDRVGVMVVRIWTEGPDGALRARLTHSLDLESREERSQAAASAEEIVRIVQEWIDAFGESEN